jgi:hypothetical protein
MDMDNSKNQKPWDNPPPLINRIISKPDVL